MRNTLIFILLLSFSFLFSQTKEELARQKEIKELLSKAQDAMEEDDFASAEAAYRTVIATDPQNATAKFNLGNAYYKRDKNSEASKRFIQAAEVAETKAEKHKIFHNLGNAFMNKKQYKPAVEAYKNALRYNPKDDETRYNLALAKKMLEEHGDSGGGGDDEQEQENQNEEQEGENQEEQNQGNEGQDNKDKSGEGEEEKQNPEQSDQGDPKEEKEGQDQGQPKPVEGKLSPQQIKNLLEAMNNEEKKVQDKINAEKQKGVKVKTDKDW
ncbi:tetratricopeptide repeat protein [Planktosalinus lacus]|uniref:BatC protein n=1 Tax=Planktosalinus lacus TaxID=1526573 RepID=A0A8J2V4V5_9FLAO|nr:tetratricopeptide repeat protein [Planktosalinus lacus]GGD81221.1 BatC protein [Planktosalinus lacus]